MKTRDSFATRLGFTLACIGSAVGMGNLWMFPTRVSLYGGGSFLIPYFIFVVLIASTGVIGEMAFGRATRSGSINAFGRAAETKGKRKLGEALGWIPTIGSLAMAIGYTVVMGWILKYTVGTFTGSTLGSNELGGYVEAFNGTASAFGNNAWLLGALAICMMITMLGIGKGIEKANKFMMPMFFVLFVGLAIYIAFQPGAIEGYRYIFRVDPIALKDPMTWMFALGQAFFSLSIAGNGTIIYGSYLADKENIPASAARVALFDTMAACIAALVIIPAMATAGTQLDQGGPGLLFIFLPNLFHSMPGGTVFAIIFFVAVFFAGMTSLLNLYETPIATMQEKLKMNRVPACIVVGLFSAVIAVCIQGIVSGWMDVLSIYICPLGAGLAAIMFFWFMGKEFVEKEVNKGRTKPMFSWYYPVCKYVFTPICFLVLLLGALNGGIG